MMKSTPFNFLLISALSTMLFASEVVGNPFVYPTPPAAGDVNGCEKFHVVADWDVVKAGDIVTFSIESEKTETQSGYFEWTIDKGYLIAGQGTSKIMVQTSEDMLTQPVRLPDPGPHGYIIHDWSRPSIMATATLLSGRQSGCPASSKGVSVGRQSRIWTNKWANVTELKLSDDQIFLTCQSEPAADSASLPLTAIDVSTTAHDEENDVVTYNYTLTGGRIIGTGANVKWDLSDVEPGTYEITAGVDDGCGICGKTITKKVTVHGC